MPVSICLQSQTVKEPFAHSQAGIPNGVQNSKLHWVGKFDYILGAGAYFSSLFFSAHIGEGSPNFGVVRDPFPALCTLEIILPASIKTDSGVRDAFIYVLAEFVR